MKFVPDIDFEDSLLGAISSKNKKKEKDIMEQAKAGKIIRLM